jgi:hypothetical protein
VALAAASPSVSTRTPASVTSSSAVLRGAVNPDGAKTAYRFEWGLTSGYGTLGPLRSATGTATIPVSLTIRHLLPGTVYHYRLVALNSVGGAAGRDRSFKTKGNPPPYAATGPATVVSVNSAAVSGVVNPNGVKTIWFFQYGLTSSYGLRTFGQTVPAGGAPVPVAAQLQGLQSGAVFHYRLVAVNRGVTQYGADATFMTFPNPAPRARVIARTRPGYDGRAPFVFTTSGRVRGHSSIPAQYACSRVVKIRFFIGTRQISRKFAPVQGNCTFSGRTRFRHRPLHHRGRVTLRVVIQFVGNHYLAPGRARTGHAALG